MDGHEILRVARATARRYHGLSQADRDDAEGAAALKLVEQRARIDPERPAREQTAYAGKVARSAVMSYLRWRSSGGRAIAFMADGESPGWSIECADVTIDGSDLGVVPDPKRWASPEDRAAVRELIEASDRLIDAAAAQLPEGQARALRRRVIFPGGNSSGADRVALHRAAPVVWRVALETGYPFDVDALLRGEV